MTDILVDIAIDECRDRMARAVEHTKSEFSGIRTGRATPALIEKLKVDYYGAEVPLQQIAGLHVPEARVLVITPYEKGPARIKAIEKAVQSSDLGITPSNDGSVIRLVLPMLTAERRKDLVKVVHQQAEEGRVAVRNVRRRHEEGPRSPGKGRGHFLRRARQVREGTRQADPRVHGRDRPCACPQGKRTTQQLTAP